MNYADMTDFEINKAVAATFLKELYDNGNCVIKCDDNDRSIFNPCKSWADAGPIIQGNAIGIMPFKKGPSESWSLAAGLLSNTTVKHNNPLRAAMVVFLKMQEGK